jgi:hypothetical protein
MRKISVVIIAVVLLVIFALLWPSSRARPSEVTVAFSGFTNDTRGIRVATFRVSNTGGVSQFRWPGYAIEERGVVVPPHGGSYVSGVLRPGDSSVCLLPLPTTSAPWRAAFAFSDNNWRRKLTGLPWARGLLPARFRSFPVREAKSDWVDDISTVAPAPFRQRLAGVVLRLPAKPQQQTNATTQPPGTNAVNSLQRVPETLPAATNPR